MSALDTHRYGLNEPAMLAKVDSLFACGCGEYIDLPQIVVVGDQSSGKSSVLEGLVRMPLPRDSGLCTRFATQIIFRRAPDTRISASIIPDSGSSPEHRATVKSWAREDLKALGVTAFSRLMTEVHELMGLSDGSETDKRPTFSKDVLCLEFLGPGQEHLSVIDVPGIFRSTSDAATRDDMALVRAMVMGYMKNPRSVMLTVIPANVDVATQEILELAKEVDPDGDRTLGILTKPDLVDKGAESKVIALLEGSSRVQKLGWHIVRNRSQQELSDSKLDRGSLETSFFKSSAPWNTVSEEKCGIESLRDRLKEVLSALIKTEFPRVQQEIRKRLASKQRLLDNMGPERKDQAAQQAFLTKIASDFQNLVSLAMSANYSMVNDFESQPTLRIAPAITTRMNAFSDDMARYGSSYTFLSDGTVQPAVAGVTAQTTVSKLYSSPTPLGGVFAQSPQSTGLRPAVNAPAFGVSSTGPFNFAPPRKSFLIRKQDDADELVELLHPQQSLPHANDGQIQNWLLEVFEGNRGFELGTINPAILATAMKKQSSKWTDISLGYISDVIVMVHNFIISALESVCKDKIVRNAIFERIVEDLLARYKKATDHTRFLLEVESDGIPMTQNHYFNDNLQKSRSGRMVASLKKFSVIGENKREVIHLDDAVKSQNMGNDDHVLSDLHDILKAYYKVTRKTFVDNTCKQATEHFLLNSAESPLKLFSPVFVSRLSAAELDYIAGEQLGARSTRESLKKAISSLSEARKIIARA